MIGHSYELLLGIIFRMSLYIDEPSAVVMSDRYIIFKKCRHRFICSIIIGFVSEDVMMSIMV